MSALAVLEVLDRDGHVRHYLPVQGWPVRAGRALDNDLILDDSYIAAHHFLIDADEAGVFVQAGDTVNGLRANGSHLAAGQRAPVGAQPVRLDVGDSHLRLRLAEHAVPAEQPMHTPRSVWHSAGLPLAAGALVLAVLLFTTWLDTDPDELTRAVGSMLVTVLVAGAAWCAGWSLVSKIFTRRSHFLWHLRVLLIGVLAIDVASALSQLLAFSLSWPLLSDFSFVPVYAIGATMLYFHALGVEPRRPARLRAAALGVLIGGTALSLWFNHQNRDQFGDELYMNHLFPPAFRLARTSDTESFVKGLAPLQASLDRKAKKRDGGDDGEGALDED